MKFKPNGFTLIEILVWIDVIAILSLVGTVRFLYIQQQARDTKRKEDLNAISKALEVNINSTGYIPLSSGQFASGLIPVENNTGRIPQYCIAYTTANETAPPNSILSWPSANQCFNMDWPGAAIVALTPISSYPANGTHAWKLCTLLEDNITIFCLTNGQ